MNKQIFSKSLGKKIIFTGELFPDNLTLDHSKKNNKNNKNEKDDSEEKDDKEIIGSAEINKLFSDEDYRYMFISGLHEISKKAPIYLRKIFTNKSLDLDISDIKVLTYIEQFN